MKQCTVCNRTYPDFAVMCEDDGAPLQASSELAPGTVIRGKYKVQARIGEGGMATVYKAIHIAFQEHRALKVVNARYGSDPDFLQRFRTEAIVTRKLKHPNAVSIEDLDFMEDGRPFMAMELVQGVCLRNVMVGTPLAPLRAVRIARQMAGALTAAHGLGITHRDIKPENVLLVPQTDGTDMVKVLDFGIAKVKAEVLSTGAINTTNPGMILGTPAYMSPEQAAHQPGVPIDGRADIYSLGVVLYEMIAGRLPFESEVPMGMLYHHVHSEPNEPSLLNRSLTAFPDLCNITMRCLEKDPARRYTAADLVVRLSEIEAEMTPKPVPTQADMHSTAAETSVMTTAALGGVVPSASAAFRATPTPKLEVAHVLFIDVLPGPSISMDQQANLYGELQRIVSATPEYRSAGRDEVFALPSGDGMALTFFGNPDAPARCAISVATALRNSPDIKLRMGLHSGPVYRVRDMRDNVNVAGGGINYAQKLMELGDPGHILASGSIADILVQHSTWSSSLHDLGTAEIKPGLRLRIFNLNTSEVGNSAVPQKMRPAISTQPLPVPTLAAAASSSPPLARTTGTDPASLLTPEVLEKATKKLAAYIGPIAGVVVKRAAKKSATAKDLYHAVAQEIDSPDDKQKFLSSLKEKS